MLRVVRAHIIDPVKGYYQENWIIGEHISEESYNRFKHVSNDIYAFIVYRDGQPEMYICEKKFWDKMRKTLNVIEAAG